MTTGQTFFTIGAFMFLCTIMLNFNSTIVQASNGITGGQDGIMATTIATSYLELAQGLAFDEITDSSDVAIENPSVLSSPEHLGPDNGAENTVYTFNDFDDFNGFVVDKEVTGNHRSYRTSFTVHYVDPDDASEISSTRTFVKRMDLKTWRIDPPLGGSSPSDTLRMSLVMGYFHFD